MNELKVMLTDVQKYLIVLIIFIVLDMLTGVISAVLEKKLKSSVFREGLLKKVLELVIVVLAFCLAWATGITELGYGTIYALMLMESYSILENVGQYIPVPNNLKAFLESSKENKEK